MSDTLGHFVKAIVFDLDGTLLNTIDDLADATNAALKQNALPTHTVEEVRGFVGNGIEKLIERAIPDGKENPKFSKVFSDFMEYYKIHCMDKTGPYPQIEELMSALLQREIALAIVSNKVDVAVKDLAQHFFGEYLSVAIGEMENVARKPAPDMVRKALLELGVSASEALYVGDSEVDIQTARNSELPCVSVTWGFRTEEFLYENGATQVIHQPLELLELLK